MSNTNHSTGRGGAGNIGDDTAHTYVDANIVREGIEGQSNRPEYSSGRGGAGNMVNSPAPPANSTGAFKAPPASEEVIPEPATREHRPGDEYSDFHTGRGGGGNVHREKYGGHSKPQEQGNEGQKPGLGEKVKEMVGLGHKGSHIQNDSGRLDNGGKSEAT